MRPAPLALACLSLAACEPAPAPPRDVAGREAHARASAAASARARPAEPAPFSRAAPVDVWIRGGDVVDGSGGARRRADVIVDGDRIVWVGPVAAAQPARAVIDAAGRVVTPGFIDLHAHSDPFGRVDHLLAQGVTTIVIGQDGDSPAPRVGPFLDRLDAAQPRVNVAALAGESTLRSDLGLGDSPSAGDLARLGVRVEEELDAGAFGLSLGLEYDAGKPAGPAELAAAIAPVGARAGIVMAHLRSEDDDKIDAALAELFSACRASGARAHVAHLKVVLGHGEARGQALLAALAAARASGLTVSADLYPYVASYTTLAILFPDWARGKGKEPYGAVRAKRRKELAAFLRARVEARNGPGATVFGTGKHRGKSLAEVAAAEDRPFEEVLIELGPSGGSASYAVMDEALMRVLLRDPHVAFGSDGAAAGAHPRGRGTFARAIGRYVREERVLSLEEAVRKASALAADTLGLAGRGRVRAGDAADLVVLDPTRLVDRADFERPERLAEGVDAVLVGGAIAWQGGRLADGRGGHALRPAPRQRARP